MKKTRKNFLYIIAKTVSICLTLCLVFLSFTACKVGYDFGEFPAIWSCDDGDIQISIITTGYYEKYLEGTLVLNSKEYDIRVFSKYGTPPIITIVTPNEDTSSVENATNNYRTLFQANNSGYKKSVTLTITHDRINPEGENSLVGRKLVLERHDLY